MKNKKRQAWKNKKANFFPGPNDPTVNVFLLFVTIFFFWFRLAGPLSPATLRNAVSFLLSVAVVVVFFCFRFFLAFLSSFELRCKFCSCRMGPGGFARFEWRSGEPMEIHSDGGEL